MRSIPEDLTALISDLETFLTDVLKGENLSRKAKEKKDAFIKRIKEVKSSYSQDFKDERDEEFTDLDEADTSNDGGSLHSEQTDRDDSAYDGVQQSPPVAAQDLPSILKSGYLEKRRKDHSFFGNEWQKRWCAISNNVFYYYGGEKDKQQKGEFNIIGYTVKMNNNLRKDAKRDCCFEISAPDKRVYQFCAASEKDAKDWVEQIHFLIKDMDGIIPEDEEEYDDCLAMSSSSKTVTSSPMGAAIDDDIYEELPEEDVPQPPKALVTLANKPPPPSTPVTAVNKSTDYANYFQGLWDCTSDHPDELSFKRGDTIYVLSKEYDTFGWWVGEMKGAIGIVPKEYLLELYAL
ncbi:src kinase-associated phosphoprotein 2-like isoform X1 [Myxocyprinus asiaticus]|uniref:src kinase-associated phosphoprotein 2-like isoform X1 n=1 Tax=Myxocyprinus asiaticus TaxID=70543 RepID=UPI002221D073|nr:src kinase-associated phosphoprotein 2-like isoform X1 [Myxocyprinus asiaticus]XP_051574429.1 src kinase-associated phosphoprotein 2-like isoform X1 [Myxocyprinus asiaticus]XP_051574430.1 src kinase-associated phosphoprotein 2-like isoform X1 [Myxocyprinus asiaticus]